MKDRFSLQAERKRLVEQREQRLAAIRKLYYTKIAAVDEQLAVFAAIRRPSAIERYTEPADAPTRYCKTCGEELLRATPENFRLMLDSEPDLHKHQDDRGKISYADLRRMQKDHCCHCCLVGNGDGSHSVWCSSVLQQGRRLEQRDAEE